MCSLRETNNSNLLSEAVGALPRNNDTSAMGESHANEFESKNNIQPPVVADFAAAKDSTSQPLADHVAKQPTNHDGHKAGVNFTPAVDLEPLSYEQVREYVRGNCRGAAADAEGLVRNYRSEAGRGLAELFRRHQLSVERGEDIPPWGDVCDSIPINRKTAYNYRMGHAAVLAADPLLCTAADERKIDLFQPRTNKKLVAITLKQAGRPITPDQLDKLLDQLDPLPDPEKQAAAKLKREIRKRERAEKASSDSAGGNDSQLDPNPQNWTRIPKTPADVLRLRDALQTYMPMELLKDDPLLAAWVRCTPATPVTDLMRPIIQTVMRTHSELDRGQVADIIATLAASVAESEDRALDPMPKHPEGKRILNERKQVL